jgi:hypothetical protein
MKPTSVRSGLRLCALSAALSLTAGAAMAQTEKDLPRSSDQAQEAIAPKAVAAAPNARLAALIQSGGTVIREKGVLSVTHPKTGIYCIKPDASTGIVPNNSIVIVSPEFFYSKLNEIKVQWAAKGSPCGNDRLAVYTLADLNVDGVYTFSNAVGFSIYVP